VATQLENSESTLSLSKGAGIVPGVRRPDSGAADSSERPLRADARRNHDAILAAAESVFSEQGTSASTEQVAARAGVAIGTVFRHFPTKDALLRAMMKDLRARLAGDAFTLLEQDPATALFAFFAHIVRQAAARKTVSDLLAASGTEVSASGPIAALQDELQALLAAAQSAGTVRTDVNVTELTALLSAVSDGALRSGWDGELQKRILAVVFAGLRPHAQ
jgi:AcrR family transcriptional regulator